jgi:hypothetical protein
MGRPSELNENDSLHRTRLNVRSVSRALELSIFRDTTSSTRRNIVAVKSETMFRSLGVMRYMKNQFAAGGRGAYLQ